MKKSSIFLVFNFQSEFIHNSTGFVFFFDWCSQLRQNLRRCQNLQLGGDVIGFECN
jgi:hypothetical protein